MTAAGAAERSVEDVPALLRADDGVLWVDVPVCDEPAQRLLADVFGFHPLAVRDCTVRNRVPKVHAYRDHLFLVLHVPEQGEAGHVHYVELDQFVGRNYVVTVHGPVNPAVDMAVALRQTEAAKRRVASGRLRPASPFEVSYAVVTGLARQQEALVELLTTDVWDLEQRVTGGHLGDPEQLLDEMFRARHGLLAVRTIAVMSAQVYGRTSTLDRALPEAAKPLVADLVDQFERVCAMADGQREYLQGVIEFYRTRTETKMTIAAERLAVIAAVTLPVTALSSILGMNLIVNDSTQAVLLAVVLAVMAAVSGALLNWAHRQGWW